MKASIKEQDMLDHAIQAGLFPNTIHHWMPALTRYTESIIKADRAQRQAEPEPVYQISCPFPADPKDTWRDASEAAFDISVPSKRRILYTAAPPPAQVPLSEGVEVERLAAACSWMGTATPPSMEAMASDVAQYVNHLTRAVMKAKRAAVQAQCR